MKTPTIFRSVDRAIYVATFTERLRGAGIEVGLSSADRFAQAMVHCAPTDLTTLYWVARTCLVHTRTDIETFDSVFEAIFATGDLPIAPQRREAEPIAVKATGFTVRRSAPTAPVSGRLARTTQPVIVDEDVADADHDDQAGLPELLPSALAEMSDTPFEQLSVSELNQLRRMLDQNVHELPTRRSRRYRPAGHSQSIDLRRTMLAARSTGGEAIRLARRQQRHRPRKIVMVADVSGSMQAYSRIYLHLMRTFVLHAKAEVFVFSTSIRRVTPQLREKDTHGAIDRLTNDVVDRFGGTRIAASLGELISSPIWSNSLRGAVVVIVSDGWDADTPDALERRMQRLRRIAHKLIWVNPRVGADDFEPLVGGMAAALPHIDRLLSGHTLNTMRDVIASLGSERTTGRRTSTARA